MATQRNAVDHALNQIFDKEYYKIFQKDQKNEKFLVGIELDSTHSPVIKGYKVKKYKNEGEIGDKNNWELILSK